MTVSSLNNRFQFGELVGCALIHHVDPVAEQQVAMGAPGNTRGQFRVVVRKIIEGQGGFQAGVAVAAVFAQQRLGVVSRWLNM